MNFKVVSYQPEHLLAIDPRDYEAHYFSFLHNLEFYSKAVGFIDTSWTGMLDGKPVICAGTIPCHPGVGEVWLVFSTAYGVEKPSRLWLETFKMISFGLEQQLEVNKQFHRLQTAIDVDFHPGIRFAERLGFSNEVTIKQYAPDKKDFYRFGRTA